MLFAAWMMVLHCFDVQDEADYLLHTCCIGID